MFSENVKALRLAREWSQQELAAKAGLSISLIQKIEQGSKGDPRLSTLLALATALGVEIKKIISEKP